VAPDRRPRPDQRSAAALLHQDPSLQPKALPGDIRLAQLEIAGTRSRVEDWLGQAVDQVFDGVEIVFTAPNGQPGISSATFETPKGSVRL